jgi:two-component system cell cycle sensor histidine kinase/response regulator CckA
MDTVMFQLGTVRVLLVEDDEDDYIITRELFAEISGQRFTLEWVKTFEAGLAAMIRNEHDVVLLDYRLGARNGVELLREAIAQGCQAPIILLTGSSQHLVDLEAMRAGADDYLVKAELQARTLERSVRYAVQRKRAAAQAAFEQARLAAFGAEFGLALTRRDSLDSILAQCARAMAQYLNAALARIEIFDPRQQALEPRATAGCLWESGGAAASLPAVKLDIESLVRGVPVLIRDLATDSRLSDGEWARREGLVSYAACPLVLEDKLIGLMSIFTRHALSQQILQEMASVATNLASCIERKRSEQALDASESKYRSVVENIKEVIFQLDNFGNWAFLNPAWTNVTGFEVETTLGSLFVDFIHPEDREHDRHVFIELLQGKLEYCRYETRLLTRDGKFRWVEAYLQPTHDAREGSPGVSGTLTDITDRKTAELQIQKLAAFPQVNPNPVLEFAGDGTLSYANEAARETARSLGREDVLSILPANAPAIVRECIATGAKRLREEVTVEGRTLVWSFFPVVGSQVVHCYGADVTDMLNLEAQFRHAQKLESVGQLAAGVAHDFNNVLTVIQGYSETLLSRCRHDPNTASALRQISEAAQRAAALTRQLLMFSRRQVIQPKLLDLNTVLQNIAKMLLRLLGEHITLETTCARNLARIEADTGMIEQVIMNLAVNARDAMPKGGKLHISTAGVTISEDYASQRPEARPGHFVRLRVADTGCGMDRKTLERIFEPFFSTKEVGKGTGLGLATVYGIVTQHQGWIEVTSEVNVGSTFDIYLPAVAADEQPSHDTAPPFTETVRGGTETVLVVEDEAVLRELVREVLKQHHYRVVEAGTGVEALRLWDEFNGEIDLLLTDMVMPEGMSGIELATQLKRRNPALRVIYTSGYSAEIMGAEFSQPGAFFLPKPYFPLQLAQLVRQALDSPPLHDLPAAAEHAR